MDICVLARFLLVRLLWRLPRLVCCFSVQVLQLKHAQPATSDLNKILQFGRNLLGIRSYPYIIFSRLVQSVFIINKTPAKHRDIFSDTLIAKKYSEGKIRTHYLMAGNAKKIKHQPGFEPYPGHTTVQADALLTEPQ